MVARRIPRQIKKKNVPNLQVKATIKKPLIPTNNGFSFCSAYSWIGATDSLWKSKGFTNMCKKKDDFADEMAELFSNVIPKIYADWKEIFNFGNHNYQYQHCHTLQGKELELSVNIAEIIHTKVFDNYEDDIISWWQIGFTGGIRIIGLYDKQNTIFYPLFIDRHHLLFPDANYNQLDFANCRYNPMEKV